MGLIGALVHRHEEGFHTHQPDDGVGEHTATESAGSDLNGQDAVQQIFEKGLPGHGPFPVDVAGCRFEKGEVLFQVVDGMEEAISGCDALSVGD